MIVVLVGEVHRGFSQDVELFRNALELLLELLNLILVRRRLVVLIRLPPKLLLSRLQAGGHYPE